VWWVVCAAGHCADTGDRRLIVAEIAVGKWRPVGVVHKTLSAAEVLSEWDSVWAFREGRYKRRGRADEVIIYDAKQAIPIFEVQV